MEDEGVWEKVELREGVVVQRKDDQEGYVMDLK